MTCVDAREVGEGMVVGVGSSEENMGCCQVGCTAVVIQNIASRVQK